VRGVLVMEKSFIDTFKEKYPDEFVDFSIMCLEWDKYWQRRIDDSIIKIMLEHMEDE